jgi:imidazolonepropionase-like amidohydrolase
MIKFLFAILTIISIGFKVNAQQKSVVILAGKIYDSEKNQFIPKQEIRISGNKIEEVGPGVNKKDAEIIDASGSTVIPGLIDAHTHVTFVQKAGESLEADVLQTSDVDRVLRSAGVLKSYLDAGFTTIRDLGNSGQFLDITLKRALKKGYITGPRMFASGPILSAPGGQYFNISPEHKHIIEKEYRIIRGVEDARNAVIEHIAMGVDLIKIVVHNEYNLYLSAEEMKEIVTNAHKHNLKVTAHAIFDKPIQMAIEAGVDGIEHAYSVSDSVLELMVAKKVYLVPTDGSFDGYKQINEVNKGNYSDNDIREFVKTVADRTLRAYKKGVTIVAGSDMYLYNTKPVGQLAIDAIISYFEAGMPVTDALKTATWNGAKALDRENQIGVLKKGAFADVVILEGDLEKNFKSVIYKPTTIIQNGMIHKK